MNTAIDQATSYLDSGIKADLQVSIESMGREVSITAIARRLSTIQNTDRIYTLESGQIVGSGTHSGLSKVSGTYAALNDMQSRR